MFVEMNYNIGDVTAIIVVFRTPDLIAKSYGSLRKFYPNLEVIIVDNSADRSFNKQIESICKHPHTRILVQSENLRHGPGMDVGMRVATSKLCLMLDSDTEIVTGNVLEEWLDFLGDRIFFASGKCDLLDTPSIYGPGHVIIHIHPSTALINREIYLKGAPFGKCCPMAKPIMQHQTKLINYDTTNKIKHYWGGTRVPGYVE